jgi:hypothetical protein
MCVYVRRFASFSLRWAVRALIPAARAALSTIAPQARPRIRASSAFFLPLERAQTGLSAGTTEIDPAGSAGDASTPHTVDPGPPAVG